MGENKTDAVCICNKKTIYTRQVYHILYFYSIPYWSRGQEEILIGIIVSQIMYVSPIRLEDIEILPSKR